MRNRATFLGVTFAIAALAAIVGGAMILRSSGDSPSSDDTAALAVPVSNGDGFSSAITDASSPEKALVPQGGAAGSSNIGSSSAAGNDASNSIIDRKIERTTTLAVTVDNVLDAVSKIQAAASGAGGYVSQQNISEQQGPPGDDGKPTKQQLATVQIRVPAESYESVMSGLRGIAKEVTSENTQTTEVTAQYTDLQSQLRNLQATEKQYLDLLSRAATIDEILTVSDRLNGVRSQIEQVQGQINLLDNLTAMATITISVTLPVVTEIISQPGEENFAVEALNNAWDASQSALEFLAVAAITAGVVMVWILVPGLLGLAGWRLLGGRRGHGPASSA
jgi:hypothetical protein